MDWHASSDSDDRAPDGDSPTRGNANGADIEVSLQNQSLTLLALMAAHPMPHRALQRFRDLLDAWRHDPCETSLVSALQARPGRFPMNVDQVVQLLIPRKPAINGGSSRRAERRSVPRLGQAPWPPNDDKCHDVWRAVDSCQHMHDLFVMALLATHTEPRRISGQFRALLGRLAKSTGESALDPAALVAVRRSAMRFDRILQIVTSALDAPPAAAPNIDAPPEVIHETRRPRAAAARSTRRSVRAESPDSPAEDAG
jgi:hypothetical protein